MKIEAVNLVAQLLDRGIEGLADAVSSLVQLASGYLADQIGRLKAVIVAGYAIDAIGRRFLGLASAPWLVILVRLGDRFGKGVLSAP